MKYLSTLLVFILSLSSAFADERYTNKTYTSITLLYWCTYKKMPSNKEDILKVANINEPNSKLTMAFDKWIDSVSYEINNDELSIIHRSKGITDGKVQSSAISTSSTNCAAFEKRTKQRDELEKRIRHIQQLESTNTAPSDHVEDEQY